MMGTDYDAIDGNFETKEQMLNHEFSNSCKPSQSMLHFIETKRSLVVKSHLYTRDPTALPNLTNQNSDPRLYDLGIFQVATQGMQTEVAGSTIGEIWVSYEIRLFKPQIEEGNDTRGQQRLTNRTLGNSTQTGAAPFINLFTGSNNGWGRWSGKNPTIQLQSDNATIQFTKFAKTSYYLLIWRMNYGYPGIIGGRCPGRLNVVSTNQVTVINAWQRIDAGPLYTYEGETTAPNNVGGLAEDNTDMTQQIMLRLDRTGDGTNPSIKFSITVNANGGVWTDLTIPVGQLNELWCIPINIELIDPIHTQLGGPV